MNIPPGVVAVLGIAGAAAVFAAIWLSAHASVYRPPATTPDHRREPDPLDRDRIRREAEGDVALWWLGQRGQPLPASVEAAMVQVRRARAALNEATQRLSRMDLADPVLVEDTLRECQELYRDLRARLDLAGQLAILYRGSLERLETAE